MLSFLLVEVFPLCRQEHQAAKLSARIDYHHVAELLGDPSLALIVHLRKGIFSAQWSNFTTSDRERSHADRKENHNFSHLQSLSKLATLGCFLFPREKQTILGIYYVVLF